METIMSLRKKLESLLKPEHKNQCRTELDLIEKQGLEEYYLHMYDNKIKVKNKCNSMVAYSIGVTGDKPEGELAVESTHVSPPD